MIRKITDYEDLLFDTIARMLDLDPEEESTSDRIRTTYSTPGQAEFDYGEITTSLNFIKLYLGGDSYDNVVYENLEDQTLEFTRTFTMVLTSYGPTSSEDLDKIRLLFMSGDQCRNLRQEKIYQVMQPRSVVRVPESFEGRYWERADFTIVFYAKEDTSVVIPDLESVQITVLTETDERRIVNV